MYITTASESRALDQTAIKDFGLMGLVLMEVAARSILKAALDHWPQLADETQNIIILAGPGQNGGDGWVLARLLTDLGHNVTTYLVKKPQSEVVGDAAVNFSIAQKLCLNIKTIQNDSDALPEWEKADLVIDALFGTGLNKPLENSPAGAAPKLLDGQPARVLQSASAAKLALSKLASSKRAFKVLAVDLPSGLSSDTGDAASETLRADLTVTLGTYKRGLLLKKGPELAGEVVLGDIGLCRAMFERVSLKGRLLDDDLAASLIPARPNWGHKGTFGHAVVCGGSPGKTGALVLAALGAKRSGCGLITVAHASSLTDLFQSKVASAMTKALPQQDDGCLGPGSEEPLLEFLSRCQALGFGPGLGLTPGTKLLTERLAENLELPMVLDADALTNLSGRTEILAKSKGKRVLTPHPAEAARLLGATTEQIQDDRIGWAVKLASVSRATVALKGRHTVIASPDGRFLINDNGSPILACGGSGDLLTGLLTGILAWKVEPFEAAALAVHLHGLAGDLASKNLGPWGVTPKEIQKQLPRAWAALARIGLKNAQSGIQRTP
ncbi:MAG: NAD(P)H-hydrate dehydratase [Deltaproteobacteria bacterium]|jgi:NAD(P)H-hydrate epimerase|nr:NAD(P)H-hydrate dehydratase [Deltaproteobacteria bacterium]